MTKMCMHFKTETDVAQNLIDDFFSSNFDCHYISIGRILSGKKWGGTRFISEKTEALHAELNERDEAATSGYQCNRRVFTIYYSLLAHTNHQNLWSRCSVHGIFLQILLTILIMVTEQLCWKKIFVAASVLYGCGYLLLLWKGVLNYAPCNSIVPP